MDSRQRLPSMLPGNAEPRQVATWPQMRGD